MDIKAFVRRMLGKSRINFRFALLLALIVFVVFIGTDFLLSHFLKRSILKQWEIQPLEERAVYQEPSHPLEEDFALLSEARPSNLNGDKTNRSTNTEQPIAVMVENYTPIRGQQAGLDQASIIYEALAEGGITRFMAVFDGHPVDRIGPIRSARPYFVSWASEYRAAFLHVGGSADALNDLNGNFRIHNVDEFADFVTIWREKQYLAPHNAYSSTEKILERLADRGYWHPMTEPRFPFKEPDMESGAIKTITIDFSLAPYAVKYEYDPTTHFYARFNGGKNHNDLKAANILVQFTETQVLDDIGRLRIGTSGAGKSIVFRDGQAIEGTWEKDCSINSPDQPLSSCFTKFFDKDGKEIPLNRGQTWIEVVPNGRAVNYF